MTFSSQAESIFEAHCRSQVDTAEAGPGDGDRVRLRRGSIVLALAALFYVENKCNYNCVVLTSPFSTYFTALGHEEAERGY